MAADEVPSTGELSRRMEDLVREVRRMADECVRRDMFEVTNRSFDGRLSAVEGNQASTRKAMYTFAGTFIAGVLVQIVTLILLRH